MSTCYILGKPNTTTAYVSRNANYLPPPPPLHVPAGQVFRLLQPRYLYDDYHYLAFVPQQIEYTGPLFGSLNPLSTETEAIERNGRRGYQLHAEQQEMWKALEFVTWKLEKRLVDRAGGVYLETIAPPPPHSFGYARTWPTTRHLQHSLSQSRAAFTAHFAFISCLLFRETQKNRKTWEDLSNGDDPIPLAYCNAFRVSWIADFDVPRIGGFVDITRTYNTEAMCMWHELIEGLLKNGDCVPLWFAYNPHKLQDEHLQALPEATLTIAKSIIPDYRWVHLVQHFATSEWAADNEERTNKLSENAGYAVACVDILSNDPPTRVTLRRRATHGAVFEIKDCGGEYEFIQLREEVPSHHAVLHARFKFGDRQKQGETYNEFMDRQRQEKMEWMGRESPDETRARLHRELKHRDQPTPDGASPAVYQWVLQEGVQIRTLVSPKDVAKVWKETIRAKRHYNECRNEYDIEPTEDAEDCLTDDDDTQLSGEKSRNVREREQRGRSASPNGRREGNGGRALRVRTPPRSHATTRDDDPISDPPFKSWRSLQDTLSSLLVIDTFYAAEERLFPTEAFKTILENRYGFIALPSTVLTEDRETTAQASITELRRTFGEKVVQGPGALTNEELQALVDFVGQIKRNELPPPTMFANHPHRPIEDGFHTNLRIQRATTTGATALVIGPNTNLETEYVLGMSALDLVHSMRGEGDQTNSAILKKTIARGSRVHQLWKAATSDIRQTSRQPRTTLIDGRPIGVGVKPHGTEITATDYVLYTKQRADLLSTALGQLALKRGGLAWRLANEHLNVGDTVFAHKPHEMDAEVVTWDVEGENYMEGTLTEQQLYILSGVYRVLTRTYIALVREERNEY